MMYIDSGVPRYRGLDHSGKELVNDASDNYRPCIYWRKRGTGSPFVGRVSGIQCSYFDYSINGDPDDLGDPLWPSNFPQMQWVLTDLNPPGPPGSEWPSNPVGAFTIQRMGLVRPCWNMLANDETATGPVSVYLSFNQPAGGAGREVPFTRPFLIPEDTLVTGTVNLTQHQHYDGPPVDPTPPPIDVPYSFDFESLIPKGVAGLSAEPWGPTLVVGSLPAALGDYVADAVVLSNFIIN